jgi:hypothetical protein
LPVASAALLAANAAFVVGNAALEAAIAALVPANAAFLVTNTMRVPKVASVLDTRFPYSPRNIRGRRTGLADRPKVCRRPNIKKPPRRGGFFFLSPYFQNTKSGE